VIKEADAGEWRLVGWRLSTRPLAALDTQPLLAYPAEVAHHFTHTQTIAAVLPCALMTECVDPVDRQSTHR